jgi:hypothetical protein
MNVNAMTDKKGITILRSLERLLIAMLQTKYPQARIESGEHKVETIEIAIVDFGYWFINTGQISTMQRATTIDHLTLP